MSTRRVLKNCQLLGPSLTATQPEPRDEDRSKASLMRVTALFPPQLWGGPLQLWRSTGQKQGVLEGVDGSRGNGGARTRPPFS